MRLTTTQESGGNELDVEESEPVDDDDLEQSYNNEENSEHKEETVDDGIPSQPPLDEYPSGAPVQEEVSEQVQEHENEIEENEEDPSNVPLETEVGVKTIPTTDTPEEDDSFFDDAPDARYKKTPIYINGIE